MKKYKFGLLAFLFVLGLFIFNTNYVEALVSGCSSTAGYSTTTGESCGKTTTPPDYQSPVISGVSGPQYLDVNEAGTWTIKAYDKNGGFLSYSVVWGDGTPSNAFEVATYKTELSISHTYSTSGSYKPKFTVINNLGQSAYASLEVRVGNSVTPPIFECKNGYDLNTGFRCGCTSTKGYSSYDGNSCGMKTFPSGCNSANGYSSTTGELCSGKAIPIPMPNPTPIATCTITSILRLGSTGADVSCLQSRIGLISDGKFGPRTLIAVKAFQANVGLKADGVVGPKSISALEVAN